MNDDTPYSKRLKLAQMTATTALDVYSYDELPLTLRTQAMLICEDAMGPGKIPLAGIFKAFRKVVQIIDEGFDRETRSEGIEVNEFWQRAYDILQRELGIRRSDDEDAHDAFVQYVESASVSEALDAIEIAFRVIDRTVRDTSLLQKQRYGIRINPDDAISELNRRFDEHGLGYKFINGTLIRVDTQYTHSELVKPVIQVLHENAISGAMDEFLQAHESYTNGKYKDAVLGAAKAVESSLKNLCDVRGWTYPEQQSAHALITTVTRAGLFSDLPQESIGAIETALGGLPALRNKIAAAHGQGSSTIEVPSYIAAYALHLAASNILVLVEASKRSGPASRVSDSDTVET